MPSTPTAKITNTATVGREWVTTPDGGMEYDPKGMRVEYVECNDPLSCPYVFCPHPHAYYRISLAG